MQWHLLTHREWLALLESRAYDVPCKVHGAPPVFGLCTLCFKEIGVDLLDGRTSRAGRES